MGNFVPTGGVGENARELISSFEGAQFVHQEVLQEGKFMKCVRCVYRGNVVVVKAYGKIPGFDKDTLRKAEMTIEKIRSVIHPRLHPNILPYNKWAENENAAILVRQYMHTNLYDRQNTRPFLNNIEKLWFSFQILKAVSQVHSLNIVHGDITSENILVSSSNWLFMADFAPFKPTLLPIDDTAPFNYFFVSNAKRDCCYVAPERFCSPTSTMDILLIETKESTSLVETMTDSDVPVMDAEHELNESAENMSRDGFSKSPRSRTYNFGDHGSAAKIRPSMDMFSVGCVIYELFNDGAACFRLADMLKYAKMNPEEREALLSQKLSRTESPELREMLYSLLHYDRVMRMNATQCLHKYVGSMFPEYFESFLHPFLADLLSADFDSPDDRIWVMCKAYHRIMTNLCGITDRDGVEYFEKRYSEWELRNMSDDGNTKNTSEEKVAEEASLGASSPIVSEPVNELEAVNDFLRRTQLIFEKMKDLPKNENLIKMINNATESLQQQGYSSRSLHSESSQKLTVPRLFHTLSLDDPDDDVPDENTSENAHSLNDNGISIIIYEICATLRFVRFPTTKCIALRLLERFARFTDDHVRLQRIVPFLVSLLQDTAPTVRCVALRVLTRTVSLVAQVPQSDTRVFPDYLFPNLSRFKSDPSVTCRITFAECLPRLATASAKYLELSRLEERGQVQKGQPMAPMGSTQGKKKTGIPTSTGTDPDLDELHNIVQEMVSNMVEQPAVVRRALLCDVTRICAFFGRERTSGHLLPILITFLNERNDWQLRATFFEHIPGVSAFVGPIALKQFLLPCITQALHDVEELVIERTLTCLNALVTLGLLNIATMADICQKVSPLVYHASIWIRNAVVRLIASMLANEDVSYVEMQVRLVRKLHPIIVHKESALLLGYTKDIVENENILKEILGSPLSRKVFDAALKQFDDQEAAIRPIAKSDASNTWLKLSHQNETAHPTQMISQMQPVMTKELSDKILGQISETDKQKLAVLDYYLRTAIGARRGDRSKPSETLNDLPVEYSKGLAKSVQRHGVVVPDQSHTTLALYINFAEYLELMASTMAPGSFLLQQRPRFKELVAKYGVVPRSRKLGHRNATLTSEALSAGEIRLFQRLRALEVPPLPPDMGALRRVDGSLFAVQARRPSSEFAKQESQTGQQQSATSEAAATPTKQSWRPRGVLCTTLYGHEGAVNRLAVSQDSLFFASASDDGTVRLWLAAGLEDGYGIRSRLTYASQGGAITDVCMIENTHSIASSSSRGTVHVFQIEHAFDNTRAMVQSKSKRETDLQDDENAVIMPDSRQRTKNLGASTVLEVDVRTEGRVNAVCHFPTVSQSVISYACESGFIHGWDLRSRSEAWKYELGAQTGYITCFAVPQEGDVLWMICGTSRGVIVVWDLRFGLIVSAWRHPSKSRINRLYISRATCSDPLVYVAASDLGLYNVSTGKLVQGYNTIPESESNVDESILTQDLEPIEVRRLVPLRGFESSLIGSFANDKPSASPSSVRAILCPFDTCAFDSTHIASHKAHVPPNVLTGGNDRRIRYWDVETANCYSIWDQEYGVNSKPYWDQMKKDNTCVTICKEDISGTLSQNAAGGLLTEGRGLPHPTSNHEDCILDLAYINSPSAFQIGGSNRNSGLLLSASRDGIVKVWV